MDKKTAIIAGGSGAVGSAVAKQLASAGFEVISLTRAECDLADAAAVKKYIESIHARYGSIDVGVYAAWPKITRKKLLDTEPGAFTAQLTEAVSGAFNFLHTLAANMREQKRGTLIGITSSVVNEASYPGAMSGYVPAKFALHGVLQTLKSELEPFGVRVHEVAPGLMRAGLNKDLPERLFEFMEEKNPGQKLATPEDVAVAIACLCSESTDSKANFSVTVVAGKVKNNPLT